MDVQLNTVKQLLCVPRGRDKSPCGGQSTYRIHDGKITTVTHRILLADTHSTPRNQEAAPPLPHRIPIPSASGAALRRLFSCVHTVTQVAFSLPIMCRSRQAGVHVPPHRPRPAQEFVRSVEKKTRTTHGAVDRCAIALGQSGWKAGVGRRAKCVAMVAAMAQEAARFA